jgi:hypothetical protein
MEHKVESMPRERQSEDFSQPVRRASDQGKRGHGGIVIGKLVYE